MKDILETICVAFDHVIFVLAGTNVQASPRGWKNMFRFTPN